MSTLTGLQFPFRFRASGGADIASGANKVRANLRSIVMTAKNERLIRKAVGTIGYARILRSMTETSGMIESFLSEAIYEFEPRVVEVLVKVVTVKERRGNSVYADVAFRIKGSVEKLQERIPVS